VNPRRSPQRIVLRHPSNQCEDVGRNR
jgi:hypothetical protein